MEVEVDAETEVEVEVEVEASADVFVLDGVSRRSCASVSCTGGLITAWTAAGNALTRGVGPSNMLMPIPMPMPMPNPPNPKGARGRCGKVKFHPVERAHRGHAVHIDVARRRYREERC